MKNNGIIATGNSQIKVVGVLAVGPQAIATNNGNIEFSKNYGNEVQQLNEFVELLRENKKSLDNVDELLESVSVIITELKSESPNRTTIRGVLNELVSSVSSISSLATAIGVIKTGILALI